VKLPAHLAEADIVISSNCQSIALLLGKGTVLKALKHDVNGDRYLLVDIAVP